MGVGVCVWARKKVAKGEVMVVGGFAGRWNTEAGRQARVGFGRLERACDAGRDVRVTGVARGGVVGTTLICARAIYQNTGTMRILVYFCTLPRILLEH